MLDLEHRALAWLVGGIETLGDHPVEPGALEVLEPFLRRRPIARGGREMDRRRGAAEHRFEPGAALTLGGRPQVVVAESQQVPRDEARRRLLGEHLHPRRGGGDAEEERLEVERNVARYDDLAVEHAALREARTKGIGELGE